MIVEVDTPGHTDAIAHSHPEHVACNSATPWATFANGKDRISTTYYPSYSVDR